MENSQQTYKRSCQNSLGDFLGVLQKVFQETNRCSSTSPIVGLQGDLQSFRRNLMADLQNIFWESYMRSSSRNRPLGDLQSRPIRCFLGDLEGVFQQTCSRSSSRPIVGLVGAQQEFWRPKKGLLGDQIFRKSPSRPIGRLVVQAFQQIYRNSSRRGLSAELYVI